MTFLTTSCWNKIFQGTNINLRAIMVVAVVFNLPNNDRIAEISNKVLLQYFVK